MVSSNEFEEDFLRIVIFNKLTNQWCLFEQRSKGLKGQIRCIGFIGNLFIGKTCIFYDIFYSIYPELSSFTTQKHEWICKNCSNNDNEPSEVLQSYLYNLEINYYSFKSK